MKKQDRRSIYTENVIKETVLTLLQTKPINKITVSEVCKIAEINRGTFYLHYIDCLNVLEHLQEEYCDHIISFLEDNKDNEHLDVILNLHKINQNKKEDFLVFMRTDLPMHSFKKLTNYGKNIIIDSILSNSSLTRDEAEWIAHYMVSASVGITQRYPFNDENTLHREEILQKFIQGGISAVIDDKKK